MGDPVHGGEVAILQLVNALYTQNYNYAPSRNTLNTHGTFWHDGSDENYEQNLYAPPTQSIALSDGPEEDTWQPPLSVRVWGEFQDFLRFRPAGADNIWVTIATTHWAMEGYAETLLGLLVNDTPAASHLVGSDAFPIWVSTKQGN